MKVILYIAITPNGMVAKKDEDSDWTSEADNKSFIAKCREASAVVMGRYTYEVLAPDNLPLEDGLQIVLADTELEPPSNKVTRLNDEPQNIIKYVEEKNYKSVVIVGGAITASEFLQANLIDEIYLDIEPLLFSPGKMLTPEAFTIDCKLKLLEVKKLSEQTVQLHYNVNK